MIIRANSSKSNNESLEVANNYIEILKEFNDAENEEINDDLENIEEIRAESKKEIEEAEKEYNDLKNKHEENKQELKKSADINFFLSKIEDELKDENSQLKKDYLKNTYEQIKDSIYLNIFIEKTYINKSKKIDNKELKNIYQSMINKLNSTKYTFVDTKSVKYIILDILEREEDKKKINKFMYYFYKFILDNKLNDYAVYITFIINNLKYIKIYPDLEQNKILINSINKIFKENL